MNLLLLHRLADLVANPRESSDVYTAAVDAVALILRAERASILVPDDSGAMRFRAWHRLSREYRDVAADHPPWARDATDASPVLMPDVLAEPSCEELRAAMLAEGIRAQVLVPITSRQRLVGQLGVHYEAPHEFSDEEVHVVQTVAHLVGLALDQARTDAANQARSDFLSVLGHELRNPLNAIVNAARVLESPAARDDLKSLAQGILQRQVSHLSRLLNDLLDEARISRGLVELQRSPVDLRTAASLAVEELSPRSAAKRQAVRLSLPEQPTIVTGDIDRLQQAISNLLDNAIKYTPEDGSIHVEVTADADSALIRVRDSGIGISADLTAIFQPFTQGSQDLARMGGGLGLGLSLVKRIVEMHGGSVRAESAGSGRGAELIVRLPLATRSGQPSAPAAPSA